MRVAVLPSIQIRKRRSADDRFIASLFKRAFAEYDAQPALTMQRLIGGGTTWIACRAELPVGFAIVHPVSRELAELCAIAVEEEARGLGVGRALLSHVEQSVSQAGLKLLRLHTAHSNLSALELFLKWGFRVEEQLPRFYRGMYDACALLKRVTPTRR